jgi:hypothetical protein
VRFGKRDCRMCLQVTAHLELASSRRTEVRPPRRLQLSRAVTALSRSNSTCVARLRDRLMRQSIAVTAAPMPYARAHASSVENEQSGSPAAVAPLNCMQNLAALAGCWVQRTKPIERSSITTASAGFERDISSLPRGFAPSFETARAEFFLFVVWSQSARLRAVHGLTEALARKCTLR